MMNDDWVYPNHNVYQPYIVELMEFFHGCVDYPSNKKFTRQELLELQPIDIKRWMANKVYGDPDYNLDNSGDRPVYFRSNTLEFAKKSISFFMPLRHPPWVDGVGGNPTKSKMVNHFLKEVKTLETRQETQTMRPVTEAEFRRTLQLFRAKPDWETKGKFSTMALLQYHLIARTDDIAHFEIKDLQSHVYYDFAMQTKVTGRLSQQLGPEQQQLQEQRRRDQILLGSIDSMSCIIMNLGLYLESFLGDFPRSKYLFTSSVSPLAQRELMQSYRSRLDAVVFHSPNFRALSTGDPRPVGMESYRKFPPHYAMGKGASQEDVDIRSRWKKRGRRLVHATPTTTDPSHHCMDAKVASLLCMGGPIKYKLRPEIVIGDEWLCENIVPNIHRRFPDDVKMCKLFALAILCATMDHASTGIHVPQGILERVTQAYAGLGFDETHPVIKVPLNVYNMGLQLMIDEAVTVSATTPTQGSVPIQAILMRIDRLERTNADYHRQHQESIQRMEEQLVSHLSTINSSICRLGGAVLDALAARQSGQNRPGEQGGIRGNPLPTNQQGQCQDLPALLSKNPRSLIDLWNEYKHGINGRKPAELFTTLERNSRVGGVKQKYYRRRIVWECLERLVRRGDSPQIAANKIRATYGHDHSVTQIINLMIRDRHTGGHPNLR